MFRYHSGIAEKIILARPTAEATCWLRMGCWYQKLSTAALSVVYSTAEYCAPVWCRSAHTCLKDNFLNDALRIVTECLRPTRTNYLPILSGIQLSEFCRLAVTFCLAYRGSLDPYHILLVF